MTLCDTDGLTPKGNTTSTDAGMAKHHILMRRLILAKIQYIKDLFRILVSGNCNMLQNMLQNVNFPSGARQCDDKIK